MTTYFGNSDTGGSWGSSNGNNAFSLLVTCPGTGSQYVESLEVYLKGGGFVRMAIYSSDLSTLICQGATQLAVSGEGWYAHQTFVDADGNPIIPELQGGSDYYLVHCYDADTTEQRWQSGDTQLYAIGAHDYTDSGFPEPISLPSSWAVVHSIRCGLYDAGLPDPPSYLGNQETGSGSWANANANNAMGLQLAYPWTDALYILQLQAYVKGTGNVRLALYSGDLQTIICQGATQLAISGEGWVGHEAFVDGNGDPVTPQLAGESYYYLVISFDNDSTEILCQTPGSMLYKLGTSDFTDSGFPEPISLPDPYAVIQAIRCLLSDSPLPSISGTLGDTLPVPSDSIGFRLERHRTASVSDTMRVPLDQLFPPPIDAEHLAAEIADSLQVSRDVATAILTESLSGIVSDRLPVIQDAIKAGKIRIDDRGRWVAPLCITPRVTDVDPLFLASHAIRHPSRYYEPRIRSYGSFDRSIAAPAGFIRTGDVSIEVLDPDNSVRQRIVNKTIRKALAELRLGPENTSLASFFRPWRREVGTVEQPGDGTLRIPLRDFTYDWMDWQVPGLISSDYFPNLPEAAPSFANIIIGEVSAEGGAIPCPLVDTAAYQYLVARHPCHSVDAVYRKRADEDEFSLVSSSEYTIVDDDVLFIDRYATMIKFAVDQEGAEIRADVKGLFDPDTGTLTLTNFADCILEVFLYLVGITKGIDRINFESFETVKAKTADLLCAGAWTNPLTFGEAFTQLQRSSNIDIFNDKNDRITIAFTSDDDEPAVHLDDLLRLHKGSVSQALADPTYNRIPYRYCYNPAADSWISAQWDNEEDQEALGDIVEEEPLNLYFVRDADTAAAVVEQRGSWLDLNAFRFQGEIPLVPVVEQLELAQIVSIEHFGGLKSGGYVAEQFKILDLSMDVDNLKYRFKGIRRRVPPPQLVETAASADDVSGGINGTAKVNARVGPFATGTDGELFAIFAHSSDAKQLRAWRTTDYGANWALADDANAPVLTNAIGSYDCFASGGLILCATQELITGRVAYHTFSLSSGSWVTVNEVVVASASNGNDPCVSIECRNATGEPVIFFQGNRELITAYWSRGYYSMKTGGAWSAPVLATPDPFTYPTDQYGVGESSHCFVERVVAGRENRMHFFWSCDPAIIWVRWSPDHYGRTLQGDLSWSGLQQHLITGVHYPAPRNLGDGCLNSNRTRYYAIRKNYWGQGYMEEYAEGPAMILVSSHQISAQTIFNSWITGNPSGLVRMHNDLFYILSNAWDRSTNLDFSALTEEGEMYWDGPEKAGPQYAYPTDLFTLHGNVLRVRGRIYLAYFSDPGYPAYRWIRVDTLPYSS